MEKLYSEEELVDNAPPMKDEKHELEDPAFEMESLPQDVADLGYSRSVKGQNENAEKMKKTVKDKIQNTQLQKSMGLLDKLHEENDLFIQKTREELRICRQRMGLLSKQQESFAAEITREKEANNM
uniref:Uncharacterized protein n=1 Tax=Jaculus jaculus TaxID=51337 RepID=A0A8C5KYI6_JACJA